MQTALPIFVIAILSTACGGAEPSADAPRLEAELGPEGGELSANAGALKGVRVVVPAGGLSAPTRLSVTLAENLNPLPKGGVAVGPQVRVGPEDIVLRAPVQVTLPFSAYAVRAQGADALMVKVWFVGPEGWDLLEPIERGDTWVTVELASPTALGAGLAP